MWLGDPTTTKDPQKGNGLERGGRSKPLSSIREAATVAEGGAPWAPPALGYRAGFVPKFFGCLIVNFADIDAPSRGQHFKCGKKVSKTKRLSDVLGAKGARPLVSWGGVRFVA